MDRNISLKAITLICITLASCNVDLRYPDNSFKIISLNNVSELNGTYRLYRHNKHNKVNKIKGYLNTSIDYKMVVKDGKVIDSYMPEIDSLREFTGKAIKGLWDDNFLFNNNRASFHVKDKMYHEGYFLKNKDTLLILFQYVFNESGEKWYMYREEPLDSLTYTINNNQNK